MAQSCCNPFDIPGHMWKSRRKNLRPVTAWMYNRAPHISMGSKICDTCRKKLSESDMPNPLFSEPDPPSSPRPPSPEANEQEPFYLQTSAVVSSLNQCLVEIGETPYSQSRARAKGYPREKVKRITEAMQRMVIPGEPTDDGTEMLQQLKEKFQSTTKRNEQLQVLTVLPKSWSIKKIQQEFGVSTYMARKSKKLVEEKGILSLPDPVRGHSLLQETVDFVRDFYESDDISRVMPGKKDFVSVKKAGIRHHLQKRLVLSNLREMYCEFKERYPDQKIGFSKFADLRPKHCILAGASGTRSVCVCTIHQNVKLMMMEVQLPELLTYHHCLAKIMCNPAHPRCYIGECDTCPGIEKLKEELLTKFDENDIDHIAYKQWVSTDRSTLETYLSQTEEFADLFCDKLELLRPHSFIAKEQASFYATCKTTLKEGEFLVTADFSENYSFVLQDSAQGFHWNNSQATLHPFLPTIWIRHRYTI